MDILQLIEELEEVLDDASNVPFSKKVAVDPDEIFEIVKEIRNSLPEEIRQAKWVNEEKDRIINEANGQANEIVQQAKKDSDNVNAEAKRRFNELVNEHEVTREAQKKGEEIIANAEKNARAVREGTFSYVDEILSNTQENLKGVLQELDRNRGELK